MLTSVLAKSLARMHPGPACESLPAAEEFWRRRVPIELSIDTHRRRSAVLLRGGAVALRGDAGGGGKGCTHSVGDPHAARADTVAPRHGVLSPAAGPCCWLLPLLDTRIIPGR